MGEHLFENWRDNQGTDLGRDTVILGCWRLGISAVNIMGVSFAWENGGKSDARASGEIENTVELDMFNVHTYFVI
jgi:hypothetical protein